MNFEKNIAILLLVLFIMYKSYNLSAWIQKERLLHKKDKEELKDKKILGNCSKIDYKYTYNKYNIYKGSQDTNLYFLISNFINLVVVSILLLIILN